MLDLQQSDRCILCELPSHVSYTGPCKEEFAKVTYQFKDSVEGKEEVKFHDGKDLSYNVTCVWNECRKVYTLHTTKYEYIHILIHQFVYSGWKVFTCFYGGVVFYEIINKENQYYDLKVQRRQEEGYKQTLTICSNEEKHKRTENPFPYTSTGNKIIIGIYHQQGASVNFNMSVSGGRCKGTFINICSESELQWRKQADTFPVFPPVPHQHPIQTISLYNIQPLHYHFPFTGKSNSCITYQIGMVYFKDTMADNPLKVHFHQYCEALYEMKDGTQKGKWCGAQVLASVHSAVPQTIEKEESFLLFSNRILNNSQKCNEVQKFKCAENLAVIKEFSKSTKGNEWNRGKQICHLINPDKVIKQLRFQALVEFISKETVNYQTRQKTTLGSLYDSLFTKISALSDSHTVLTFDLIPCNKRQTMLLLKDKINLNSKSADICLRKSARGVLPTGAILQLSLEDENLKPRCNLGKIKSQVNLCITKDHLLGLSTNDITYLVSQNILRQCVQTDINSVGVKYIWEVSLLSNHFMVYKRGIIVDLPGKILDILLQKDFNCCLAQSCFLRAQWTQRTAFYTAVYLDPGFFTRSIERQLDSFPRKQFCAQFDCTKQGYFRVEIPCLTDLFCLISYSHHKRRPTWYEARLACEQKQMHRGKAFLPIFLNHMDVEELIHFLGVLSFARLITVFFIGLHRKVSLYRSTLLAQIGIISTCCAFQHSDSFD